MALVLLCRLPFSSFFCAERLFSEQFGDEACENDVVELTSPLAGHESPSWAWDDMPSYYNFPMQAPYRPMVGKHMRVRFGVSTAGRQPGGFTASWTLGFSDLCTLCQPGYVQVWQAVHHVPWWNHICTGECRSGRLQVLGGVHGE